MRNIEFAIKLKNEVVKFNTVDLDVNEANFRSQLIKYPDEYAKYKALESQLETALMNMKESTSDFKSDNNASFFDNLVKLQEFESNKKKLLKVEYTYGLVKTILSALYNKELKLKELCKCQSHSC